MLEGCILRERAFLGGMGNKQVMERDPKKWAEVMFGQSELGDARRTRRAVKLAGQLAANPGGSIQEVCEGNDADAEGAYRFIENDEVKPEALEENPFKRTAALCINTAVVLAIQDTTTLSYNHSVASQLGDLGGGRGFVVHSTLAVDAETKEVLGLLDQQRWIRVETKKLKRRKKKSKNNLPYEKRESYKWERSSQRIESLVDSMDNVIQVGDREADIYEYLSTRIEKKERFVIRASHDRKLKIEEQRLREFMQNRAVLGTYEVTIGQRGAQPAGLGHPARENRKDRTATMELRSATVRLRSPENEESSIPVRVVYVREQRETDDSVTPLEWLVLTSEPVATKEQARQVIKYYEYRWLIEEYHKVWKTGCSIEQRRLQTPANLERIAVLTAHVAVRLLQLRSMSYSEPSRSCDTVLDEDEWHLLFMMTEKGQPLPDSPLSLRWAIESIARLGGWRDTKRTGRIGWISLWRGWARFQERLIGWRMARAS